jgi:membrane dipeptidase
MPQEETLDARLDRLHQPGLVDMHFDMLMDLFEKRHRQGVLDADYLPNLQAGNIGVLTVAIYVGDQYLPEMGLRVALDQAARLYAELDHSPHFALCRSYADILQARQAGRIALLLAMEGVEPLGGDLDLLRVFYELGLRVLGLTHARRNQAGDGGLFAPTGSSPAGLSPFGRAVIRQCQSLGIVLDLAHLNPAGFDEAMALTRGPVIISHTNPRRFYDIERNSSEAQIRQVGERGGVVGLGALLLSPRAQEIHLDNYVDQIEYVAALIGIDGVGLGFDFFKFIYETLPPAERARLPEIPFMADFTDHAHTGHLTRKLIERGFSDEDIEKILYRNFWRVLAELLV